MPARLDDTAIDAALLDLQAWAREGAAIVRSFDRKDFDGSIALVDEIARLAKAANHHPDLAVSWGTVTVTLTSHDAGGVTQRDLDLAKRLDALERRA